MGVRPEASGAELPRNRCHMSGIYFYPLPSTIRRIGVEIREADHVLLLLADLSFRDKNIFSVKSIV